MLRLAFCKLGVSSISLHLTDLESALLYEQTVVPDVHSCVPVNQHDSLQVVKALHCGVCWCYASSLVAASACYARLMVSRDAHHRFHLPSMAEIACCCQVDLEQLDVQLGTGTLELRGVLLNCAYLNEQLVSAAVDGARLSCCR